MHSQYLDYVGLLGSSENLPGASAAFGPQSVGFRVFDGSDPAKSEPDDAVMPFSGQVSSALRENGGNPVTFALTLTGKLNSLDS